MYEFCDLGSRRRACGVKPTPKAFVPLAKTNRFELEYKPLGRMNVFQSLGVHVIPCLNLVLNFFQKKQGLQRWYCSFRSSLG